MTDPTITLFTSRYAAPLPPGMVTVRITRYPPRWRLPYPLAGTVMALAPPRRLFHEHDRQVFTREFTAHLDQIGPDAIRRLLEDLGVAAGGLPLVLLCYEDVTRPGEWCHRLIVAEWLHDRLGLVVPEITLLPAALQVDLLARGPAALDGIDLADLWRQQQDRLDSRPTAPRWTRSAGCWKASGGSAPRPCPRTRMSIRCVGTGTGTKTSPAS